MRKDELNAMSRSNDELRGDELDAVCGGTRALRLSYDLWALAEWATAACVIGVIA
jgi:hypothetical protein